MHSCIFHLNDVFFIQYTNLSPSMDPHASVGAIAKNFDIHGQFRLGISPVCIPLYDDAITDGATGRTMYDFNARETYPEGINVYAPSTVFPRELCLAPDGGGRFFWSVQEYQKDIAKAAVRLLSQRLRGREIKIIPESDMNSRHMRYVYKIDRLRHHWCILTIGERSELRSMDTLHVGMQMLGLARGVLRECFELNEDTRDWILNGPGMPPERILGGPGTVQERIDRYLEGAIPLEYPPLHLEEAEKWWLFN
jgi:hypothetical protein